MQKNLYISIVAIGGIALAGIVIVCVMVPEQAPTLIVLIAGFAGTLVANLFSADKVVEKLEKTTSNVDKKLNTLKEESKENLTVTNKTYVLSNSNMAVQLKLNAELSRWKADQKPDNDGYRTEAERAEKLYAEHQQKQALIDAQMKAGNGLSGKISDSDNSDIKNVVKDTVKDTIEAAVKDMHVTADKVEINKKE